MQNLEYKANLPKERAMIKADKTVRKETKYIGLWCGVLSIILQGVFIILNKWDYTVLLGNLLSFAVAVLNFYFMGLSVQKALAAGESDAPKIMKASQSLRNMAMFLICGAGVLLPYFNTVAVLVPIFFPRIAVAFRGFFKEEKEVTEVE